MIINKTASAMWALGRIFCSISGYVVEMFERVRKNAGERCDANECSTTENSQCKEIELLDCFHDVEIFTQ